MPSNKRRNNCLSNGLRSDTLKRQSFSERICDDLCEEILQYLSLEDKLRLECVSKQFQRTILIKQYTFHTKSLSQELKHFLFYSYSTKKFELLLKKCPNIRSVELKDLNTSRNHYNQVFQLVTKYCNNLVELIAPLNHIRKENFDEFETRFGSKLKHFRAFNRERSPFPLDSLLFPPFPLKDMNRLNSFPNIEKLFIRDAIPCDGLNINQLNLVKLRAIDICVPQTDKLLFNKLIEKFKTIRYLTANVVFDDKNAVKEMLTNVSALKQLIYLKVSTLFFGLNGDTFSNSLKQIAEKCEKLKYFECSFEITSDTVSNISESLRPLKAFKQLNHLVLFLNDRYNKPFDLDESFSLETLKQLSNLTHLVLAFKQNQILTDQLLTNIDIYFPKLQSLYIFGTFQTPEGTTLMTDILSRLSRLETIRLRLLYDMELQMTEEIIQKCRKIKRVDIKLYYCD